MTKDARLWNYLDRSSVEALVKDHLDGVANRRLLIWSLLNLETWLGLFTGAAGRDLAREDAAQTPRRTMQPSLH
jgi:asparagine synthase (glutamine-hydrolysing)